MSVTARPRLERLDIPFEIITPTYLGGPNADQRGPRDDEVLKADARTPGVRGLIAEWRFWFRALAGGLVGTSDSGRRAVAKAEADWFGGGSEDGASSRFLASLEVQTSEIAAFADGDYGRYLGYGLGKTLERRSRYALKPGNLLGVRLVASNTDRPLLEAIIRVATVFGGVGARHRRGWGQLQWGCQPAADGTNLVTQLAAVMKRARDEVRTILPPQASTPHTTAGDPPEWDVVHKDWCTVALVRKRFFSVDQAMTAIRNQLRVEPGKLTTNLGDAGVGWRQRRIVKGAFALPGKDAKGKYEYFRGTDHDDLVGPLRPHVVRTLHLPLLGLPVAYPSWGKRVVLTRPNRGGPDIEIRRPSPLSFRVLKVAKDHYRVMIVVFKRPLHPHDSDLYVRADKNANANWSHVDLAAGMEYLDDFVKACDADVITIN